MDREPKTRQELKGKRGKEGKKWQKQITRRWDEGVEETLLGFRT